MQPLPEEYSMTALVVGSTGLIGRELIKILLESNNFSSITSLVRRPAGVKHEKLKEITVDFDQLENYKDQMKADHFFCCLGTTIKVAKTKENFYRVDFTYPHETAKIAKEVGARSFSIVTAIGADHKSAVFYNRTKGEIEEALKKLELPTLHIFRPSLLMGEREESRLGEKVGEIALGGLSFLMVGPLRNYRAIRGEVVARVMAELAMITKPGTRIIESGEIQTIYDRQDF